MSDWFNYGFNEEAWKAYCQKQKTLREEYQLQRKIKVPAPLPDTALTAAPRSPTPRRRCTRPVTARDPTAAEIAALRAEMEFRLARLERLDRSAEAIAQK